MPEIRHRSGGVSALTHAVESYVTWAYNNNASNRNAEEAVVKIFRNQAPMRTQGTIWRPHSMLIASTGGAHFNSAGIRCIRAVAARNGQHL
ncbi:MAG: iron-containing alcohol dehydrogenase [Oscillospiraceae bacterium]